MAKMMFNTPLAKRRIEHIQYLLRRENLTAYEIADGIHMQRSSARPYVRFLHQNGMIHIAEWRKQVRTTKSWGFTPVYCWRKATDAPRPPRMANAEVYRRYVSDPDNKDRIRAKDIAKRSRPHRDWTAAWIPTRSAA